MQEVSMESILHQLGILEKLLGNKQDALETLYQSLQHEIAEARAFHPLLTTIAADDPIYRFDLNPANFLSYITNPVAFLASRNLPMTFSGLILIGRYQKLPLNVFARVSGVPGTHIAFVSISTTPVPQSMPNTLVNEHVLLDYFKGTDRTFFHQQVINATRKATDPTNIENLKVTRQEASQFVFEVIKKPVAYAQAVPVANAGSQEPIKYRIVDSSSSAPVPSPQPLPEPISYGPTSLGPALARGFVVELADTNSLMCAVAEAQNIHPIESDLPGNGIDQELVLEQLTIKCY